MSERKISADELRAAGVDEDRIAELVASGDATAEAAEPWRPTTLEDVDWLVWRLSEMEREKAVIEAQAARRVKAIDRRLEAWNAVYGPAIQALVREAIEAAGGKRRSVDLERCRVGLRKQPGRYVVNSAPIVAELTQRIRDDVEFPNSWAEALKVTVETRGWDAVDVIRDGKPDAKVTLLAGPIQHEAYQQLYADPETGEKLPHPNPMPGVTWQPPVETLTWSVPDTDGDTDR